MKNNQIALAKIRRFGGYMSGMIMPNLGAFVGWGILAALFIPTGWLPNESFNKLVGPMLNSMLPMLIGYTAGYNIHGQRGGVIGLFTTMGVIVGSSVTMFSGAMVMGPLSACLLKKFDQATADHIKPGFEMLVNNCSLGILGAVLAVLGFIIVGPVIGSIVLVLTTGINWIMEQGLIPLLAVFMCPAQVLFLNNAVNHGILSPIAYQQAAEFGKSIIFLVDSNCGPLLGTLCSIAVWGKGKAQKTAPMAMFIAGIAGIGEVYFPFVLANPILLFATMGGLSVSLFLLVALGGGLVGMPSPGSLLMIAMMTPKDAAFANFIAIAAGFAISFCLGSFLLKAFGSPEDDAERMDTVKSFSKCAIQATAAAGETAALSVAAQSVKVEIPVRHIIVACDSGMGSSAMGASVLRERLKKEGYQEIKVTNSSVGKAGATADIIITLESLLERAKISVNNPDVIFLAINNFLKGTDYDEAVKIIKRRNS